MLEWLQSLLSVHGYWIILLVVFLNNLGLPISGDVMILGGGFLAHQGTLSFGWVAVFGTLACFMGGNASYWVGQRFGPRLLKKMSWLPLSPKRIHRIENFFHHYGAKVVFFARLVALFHPVTGLLAGMWKTPLRPFLFYNLVGSAAYAVLYGGAGYFLGQGWKNLKIEMNPTVVYVLLILAGLLILWLFLRRSLHDFIVHHLPKIEGNGKSGGRSAGRIKKKAKGG